ncbi:MAG TPA: N-acetylmuramoyl-L-alanine amidase [Candidatus Sericytochromatia bacterium]
MRFRWLLLLSSFLSVFLFSAAAQARELLSWRFDTNQNRLEFTTDAGVQPKAQLIPNPTRVVIDLPGISLRRSATQPGRGGIREIRVGQLDTKTTRIVIELAPGFTLDPQQVKFRGATANQWSVDLPTPQPVTSPPGGRSQLPPSNNPPNNQSSLQPPPLVGLPPRSLPPLPASSVGQVATIQAVDLENNGTQLLIRADRGVRATSTWDARENAYRITIPSARLANQVRGPQLNANSPLARVSIRQQDSGTVVILVQPSINVRIGELNQLNDQLLALQLQQGRPEAQPISSIPVPPPERTTPIVPPTQTTPPGTLPRVPNGRIIVMVDPGHGGPDPGAVGIGGLQEKGVVMSIAQQVATLLDQQGVQAVLTRTGDYDFDLEPRVAMAERMNANLFVSIHANAIDMSRPDVNGLETYYYSSPSSGRLAQTIHKSILQGVNVADRGVRTARFYVLRRTSMPSVLIEVGFVTGREDAAKLSNPTYQTQMAQAIARGILQYLQQTSQAS